jgi:tRNA U34 5-methylaminomethyl-2-thiouridine-forming methyltransferase MnmC
MERTLITTADGSHSLYVQALDEHYHSIHGAIQEAIHVFIKTGLTYLYKKNYTSISIVEIGFGTGLNALLTCLEAEKLNINIHYTALEAFPVKEELLNELNYVNLISDSLKKEKAAIQKIFQQLHTCEWEKPIVISKNFTLHKINQSLQEIKFTNAFDLIYFDAFGPRVQPEMWTEEVFSKIHAATKNNGCLVTYCAKGEVKRTLKKVGYVVETLPGPPRKREMVRGTKIEFAN